MSKLPQMPVELAAFANTGILLAALNDIVSEYGQQCRDAALDEAADALMKCDLSGLNEDHYLLSYTAQLMLSWATYIRTLKNEQTTLKASA